MTRFQQFWKRKTHERGQALAEAAFVFVIVILLLAGLVEFGWAYFHYLALQNAAGEGAAYGLMFPNRHQGEDEELPNYSPNPDNITYRTIHESDSTLLDWSSATISVTAPFLTAGNNITVTVTYEHDVITPLLSTWISDGTITLRAQAIQRILSPPQEP